MSDLCSPMIILLNDEADAFWCFERLMRRLRGNFRCTDNSVGVEAQLSTLATITQMMWALEYDPDLFWMYEDDDDKSEESKGRLKSLRHYGKYERENMKNGAKNGEDPPLPISVFLVASVLKDKSTMLLQQAKGLDDVVKILNDVNGNLDAKKACVAALKLHKKYLKKCASEVSFFDMCFDLPELTEVKVPTPKH
ncbi:hypothetical protein JHK82_033682 [Glycine max]|nr:hypothetical protein JHK85_034401 [Glycine max]KAG5119262.1 hypothetical protein JHK82_033682 [Glycine max]KAG5140256.1 hypothetical protein JHK84_034024 [Glycine max]